MALKENVATYDELDMATTRLRLRLPEEPVPEVPQPNVLEPMEVHTIVLCLNKLLFYIASGYIHIYVFELIVMEPYLAGSTEAKVQLRSHH